MGLASTNPDKDQLPFYPSQYLTHSNVSTAIGNNKLNSEADGF
jgi:hypothetical protein